MVSRAKTPDDNKAPLLGDGRHGNDGASVAVSKQSAAATRLLTRLLIRALRVDVVGGKTISSVVSGALLPSEYNIMHSTRHQLSRTTSASLFLRILPPRLSASGTDRAGSVGRSGRVGCYREAVK